MHRITRLLILAALLAALLPLAAIQAQDGPPTARLVCAQYVRQEPNNDAQRVGLIEGGPETLLVLAYNARINWAEDGLWLVVEQPSTGLRGWMYNGDCLVVSGNILLTPEVLDPGYQGPPIANVVCDQYLRSRPNTDSTPLTVLLPSEPSLYILGRDAAGDWLFVQRAAGGQGWVQDVDCISTEGRVFDAPVVSISYEGPPTATLACTQYARLEPDNDAVRLTIFYPGDGPLGLIGRDVYANWFLVIAPDGRLGWMYDGDCLVINGNRLDVQYPPPSAVNNFAIAPSAEIGNVPQVSGAVVVTAIALGQYVVQPVGVPAPLTTTPLSSVPAQTLATGAPASSIPTGAAGESAPAAVNPNAIGGPGETVQLDVNCHTSGTAAVRAGSAVTLALRWETTDPALARDWIDAQRSEATLNGSALPDLWTHLTSEPVENRGNGSWVAGYYYPLGPLTPGHYDLYWNMTLGRDISTGRQNYAAGGYQFYCGFDVQ